MDCKCSNCGHIFDYSDRAVWSESRGVYWGFPCEEVMSGCPVCNGDFGKAIPCAICGKYHFEDELNGGVCDECINSHRNDFEACYNISSQLDETQNVAIDALIASLIDPSDINQILKEYIFKRFPNIDCSKFINEDVEWFGEMLAEEVRKKNGQQKRSTNKHSLHTYDVRRA